MLNMNFICLSLSCTFLSQVHTGCKAHTRTMNELLFPSLLRIFHNAVKPHLQHQLTLKDFVYKIVTLRVCADMKQQLFDSLVP